MKLVLSSGNLASVSREDAPGNAQSYSFTYDAYGNALSTLVGTPGQSGAVSLMAYAYGAKNGPLLRRTYGNGDAVSFTYDALGRAKTTTYDDGRTLTYTYTGDGQGVLGNNMFAYCLNCPIIGTDATGCFSEFFSKLGKKIKKVANSAIDYLEENLSKVDFTLTTGVSANLSTGIFTWNPQVSITLDTKGNVEMQGSYKSGGISTGDNGVGISVFQAVTNAPSAEKINGPSAQLGGSAPIPKTPISANADLLLLPDDKANRTYHGVMTGIGFPASAPEFHAIWGETEPIAKFNYYNLARDFVDWAWR